MAIKRRHPAIREEIAHEAGFAAKPRHREATPNLIPVLKPLLPGAADILSLLQSIDDRRWYSNYGPLVCRLEDKFSEHFQAADRAVVTVANATLGIAAALLALGVPADSLCIMPSWTFAATPHAARIAGVTPWFHDVDGRSWALDPGHVKQSLKRISQRVGAVIVVSPFGAPLDVAAWELFETETGIPVLIDAAAGFDTVRLSRIPSVVSLHATKILGAGEGGFVLTSDLALRERVMACCNFGFCGSRTALAPALNSKMSEYHAAVALASFAAWRRSRARHARISQWYRRALGGMEGVSFQPGYAAGWVTSTTNILLPPGTLDPVAHHLLQRGIETRMWWGQGCHLQPAFGDYPRGPLPVTEELGSRVLGLPHYLDMQKQHVDAVALALSDALPSRAAGQLAALSEALDQPHVEQPERHAAPCL